MPDRRVRPGTGQRHDGLIQLLHPQGRLHLHPHHRRLPAGVGEPVEGAGRHHDLIAWPGDDRPPSLPEFHGPALHLEALLLQRVDVAAWDLAVGVQDQFERQQRSRAVVGGGVEDEPLAADRVVEYLSADCHWSLLCSSVRETGPLVCRLLRDPCSA